MLYQFPNATSHKTTFTGSLLERPSSHREIEKESEKGKDIQSKLDKMAHIMQCRAEQFFPGIEYALSEKEHYGKSLVFTSAANKKSNFIQSFFQYIGSFFQRKTMAPSPAKSVKEEDPVSTNTEDKKVEPLSTELTQSVEHSSEEEEIVLLGDEHNETTSQSWSEPVVPLLSEQEVAIIFQNYLDNPSANNRVIVALVMNQHAEAISPNLAFYFLVGSLKKGLSREGTNLLTQLHFSLASQLAYTYSSAMSDCQRLGLVHYAITSNNKDFFTVLARANEIVPASDSPAAKALQLLTHKMKNHPEHFAIFKDLKAWENLSEMMDRTLRNGYELEFDEKAFLDKINSCLEAIQSEEEAQKTPFELCMNAARLEGFKKHPRLGR